MSKPVPGRPAMKRAAGRLAIAGFAVLLALVLLKFLPSPGNATLMAVGDIYLDDINITSGYNPGNGTYNFSSYFDDVRPILERGDFVVGNLETRLAGEEKVYVGGRNAGGYTGYPLFNAPARLAIDLKGAGFTLLATANNHSLDRGVEGIFRTNENLEKAGLAQTGTFSSPQDRNTPRIIRKNGISIAFFSYTEHTNGLRVPKGMEYILNRINLQKIREDIRLARKEGADLVVCALHFGDEFTPKPNDRQKRIARSVLALGADIILGSHPHILQPHEIIEGSATKLVVYSAGNFLSDQTIYGADKGAIYEVDIRKRNGRAGIAGARMIPTLMSKYFRDGALRFRILAMPEAAASRQAQ